MPAEVFIACYDGMLHAIDRMRVVCAVHTIEWLR